MYLLRCFAFLSSPPPFVCIFLQEKKRKLFFSVDVRRPVLLRLSHFLAEPFEQARPPGAGELGLHIEVLGAEGRAEAPAET